MTSRLAQNTQSLIPERILNQMLQWTLNEKRRERPKMNWKQKIKEHKIAMRSLEDAVDLASDRNDGIIGCLLRSKTREFLNLSYNFSHRRDRLYTRH